MSEKIYYWAEDLEHYHAASDNDYNEIIEIKRLNFFIGKNNAGKSKFLRTLFTHNYPSNFYQNKNLVNNLRVLNKRFDELEKLNYSMNLSDFKHSIKEMNKLLENNTLNQLIFINSTIKQRIDGSHDLRSILKDFNFFELSDDDIQDLNSLFNSKFYIPVLRGMRPVTSIENKQPYIERTQKDYFKNIEKFNSKNIITGECLYYELKSHLLGEPEQRELIKQYEQKLSQYFFDNKPITLIPKFGKDESENNIDMVHIKIDQDNQFPVSMLGDGLQQVIILTYEAFIKKDKHAFFIEEPELHMHAGMVRQLMNFYLNETEHYYFFTTHSNHLLDMADESDQVIIQKFVKKINKDESNSAEFSIYRCNRDRDLLASLGVKPSSVYLANCTIWVEGITDRLYITKFMEKFLTLLEKKDSELYTKYRRFMPNYHYTFVEYAGSNLTHWSFCEDYPHLMEDKGLSAKAIASDMLLIADGDIQNKSTRSQVLDLNGCDHQQLKAMILIY
ncbi:AAA ATPase domain protein [Acinetobacter sp. 1000160]|nr:AAA ATPase domain protein [Acinetobacter baumannii 146457]EYT17837.1 AAA ATPase domain protein [Acinetobacter sp. 1000160]